MGTRSSLQYFIWLISKTAKIYSEVKSVKSLLVLSIFVDRYGRTMDGRLDRKKIY